MNYNHQRIILRKKLAASNTWESEKNGINLSSQIINPRVSLGLGKKRDAFDFNIRNQNDTIHQTFFSGDNSTTNFTLKWSPIPSEMTSGDTQKLFVYISDVLQVYTTDYTISGSTLTFVSAPATGVKNIKVVFPVVEADDLFDVYFWNNNDFSSLTVNQQNVARKIEGLATEPSITKENNMITIRGFGLIDTIFAGMAFARFDPETVNKSHLVIQQIITQLNAFNPNRRIFGQNALEWAEIGNSEPTNTINYTAKYRTSVELIEELSTDKYTGDGQYIYWVEFNARTGTTTSTTSSKLVDSTASFTDAIDGLVVHNTTDGTKATITNVDSGTTLTLDSDIFVSGEGFSIPTYDFHWKTKPVSSTSTITEGTELINLFKSRKAIDDIINVVIFNAGLDPHGRGMEFLNYDFTITGFGARWKYVSETSTIGREILDTEFENDPSKWNTTTDGSRKENFPKDAEYSYTCQFVYKTSLLKPASGSATSTASNKLIDSTAKFQSYSGVHAINGKTITNTTDSTTATINSVDSDTQLTLSSDIFTSAENYSVFAVASDDDDFADLVRREAEYRGNAATDDIIRLFSNPRFKVNLTINNATTSTFVLGNVYTLKFPSFGMNGNKLRLIQIDYGFWQTILFFEEDETTIEI